MIPAPIVVQGLLGMLLASLAGSFALAFGSDRDAVRAVGRIRKRRDVFRLGALVIGAGVVFAAEANAVAVTSGIPRQEVPFTAVQAAAYLLLVLGVVLLDVVLWWPESRAA